MNKYLIRLIKVIAFIGIIYLIFVMVKNRDSISIVKSLLLGLSFEQFLFIGFVFLLQFLNWILEAYKFKLILAKKEQISFSKSVVAVYIGNASSLFTPDRLGNFIGRAFHLREINKIVVTSATMLGNLAQLWSTLIFAFIGMFLYVSSNNYITIVYTSPVVILAIIILLNFLVALVYFYPRALVSFVLRFKILKKHRYNFFFLAKYRKSSLALFLSLSIIRYLIFIGQFYILLFVFGIDLELIELLIFIGLMYFVTTLIPSPILGNLGTRELVAIYLLSYYNQPESILVASLLIWLINVIFPALLGFVFAFNLNLYKKDL